MHKRSSSHPMSDYVESGRYARDKADQSVANSREAHMRNDAIRRLAKSDSLEDKILAIMAARDWYNFRSTEYAGPDFNSAGDHTQRCREIARAVIRFMDTGEFPGIYNPGSVDAHF